MIGNITRITSVSISLLLASPSVAQVAAQRQTNIEYKSSVNRAAAYAPNIISKCSGSLAGGAQGQFAGFSISGSYKDDFCERAELIKLAISMGHNDIADDLFSEFPMVKDLYKEEIREVCDYPTKCRRRQ